ncbi:hypothetical protein KGN15_008650 [Lactococcus lactis]|uniref:hypothetical protein n=1 Tax=Lactococcus lactis TaxID=1358 RepID=UPI0020A70AA3|nr:hypothetical protein [Lactococcus lactis]
MNFDTQEYQLMIADLIHDTFYVNLSNGGKIKGIRQFSEVLVRRILGVGSDRQLMLGKLAQPAFNRNGHGTGGAKAELEHLSSVRKEDLLEIIERIRPLSNDATHTQHTKEFTDDELSQVADALFDLYAYLFTDYFLKYPLTIDTRAEIYRDFSLLPPIIRYKTLNYLFESGQTNIYVSDRLCLAMVKAYDKNFALKWLSKHKEVLTKDLYPNEQQRQIMFEQSVDFLMQENQKSFSQWIAQYGKEKVIKLLSEKASELVDTQLRSQPYRNSFELCLDKINKVSDLIAVRGKMYEDFERAISYYQKYKNEVTFPELEELQTIMDFVYLGRKATGEEIINP